VKKALPLALAATLVGSAALAQTTTTPPTTTPPATTPAPSTTTVTPKNDAATGMTLSDQQARAWIDKTVYSSDNKNVGEVAEIRRDSSGKVTELYADVGGFLGLGEHRIQLMPGQFKFGDDRVMLNMAADQVKALPKVAK